MTREEAIHKMEYSKRAYQMLIDEKVQEGVLVGHGINAEWSADTSIIDAYKDMLDACEMAIKALEQKPKTGHWIIYNYPGHECVYCSSCKEEYYEDDLYMGGSDFPNYCPHCGARMAEESEG